MKSMFEQAALTIKKWVIVCGMPTLLIGCMPLSVQTYQSPTAGPLATVRISTTTWSMPDVDTRPTEECRPQGLTADPTMRQIARRLSPSRPVVIQVAAGTQFIVRFDSEVSSWRCKLSIVFMPKERRTYEVVYTHSDKCFANVFELVPDSQGGYKRVPEPSVRKTAQQC